MKAKKSFWGQLLQEIIKSGVVSFGLAILVSFLAFFPFLKKDAVSEAGNTNATVLRHLDSTLSFVESYTENISVSIEQNIDIQKYLENPTVTNRTAACVALNNYSSYMRMIRGIMVAVEGAAPIDSMTNFTQEDYELLETDFFDKMKEASFMRSYSQVYKTWVSYNCFYTVVYARNFYLNNRWTTILMYMNLNNVLGDIRRMVGNTMDAWYLTDECGQNFYSEGKEKDIKAAEEIIKSNGLQECHTDKGDIVLAKHSTTSGYGIVSMVKCFSVISLLLPYTAGLFLAMLFFMILILAILSRNINVVIKPVINLSAHMLRAAQGDLECHIHTVREDEIGQLERAYNKMIDDLKQSIEVISEKEAREQQIRFSLLVSQIDPHFIYNTINSINYLARKQRYEDIVKVNSALCTILRDRLKINDIQIKDTVANEMRVVNQYIEIEKYMYGGNLEVVWEVEDEWMEYQIPKNMIQPLVENALFHGLIGEEDGEFNGRLVIRLYQGAEKHLVLQVEDNGFGMDEERLDQVKKQRFNPQDRGYCIGLANIRGRLHYLYGDQECMEIESYPKKGTCITITFCE